MQGARAANAASNAVLAAEALGSALMWAAMPLAWLWIGARVNEATGSVAAGGAVAMLGLLGAAMLDLTVLSRLDDVWIGLRRRAGHDQAEGALTQVVVISATVGIIAFLVWYVLLKQAFIMPFMPTQ